MRKLKKAFSPYSVSLLLLVVLLHACSPAVLKGYRKSAEHTPFPQSIIDNPPLVEKATSFYNMQIDYGKTHFSGMLIVKPTADTTYRVALTSHFGMSVFDFTITPSTFTMHSCMDALDKENIKRTLRDDMRTFLFLDLHTAYQQEQLYQAKNADSSNVHYLVGDGVKAYYRVDGESRLSQISKKAFIFTTNFSYDVNEKGKARLTIKHKPINLTFTIEEIDRESVR